MTARGREGRREGEKEVYKKNVARKAKKSDTLQSC
jgi:hypothetical protein